MMRDPANEKVIPLLITYAVERVGEPKIDGSYSSSLHVWAVPGLNGEVPIIRARGGFGRTTSSTAVRAEADDTDLRGASFGGTSTFTKVVAEADDTDIDQFSFAGTTTFTEVRQEADDTDVSCDGILEVTTKTMAQIEGDDTLPSVDLLAPRGDDEHSTGMFRLH